MSSRIRNIRKESGITLIALIITIIILVILAAVSIRAVYNMGILGQAVNGTKKYAQGAVEENQMLDETGRLLENTLAKLNNIQGGSSENGGGNNPPSPTVKKGPTGKPLVNKDTVASIVTGIEPLDGEDEFGNHIKIPVGFKVAQDSGANVTEGIVIEDDDIQTDGNGNQRGNQYVWIPTGTIYTDKARTAANAKEIIPGRYEFADGSSTYKDADNNTLAKGTPILKQSLANHNNTVTIKSCYQELPTHRTGVASTRIDGLNTTATSLSSFASSVASNGGFYIARYEASWGTGDKVKSRVSTGTPLTSAGTRTNGQLWNFITQLDAAVKCQGIYERKINSDLMNSYAWDTAIVYIQTFSGDEDYSYQTSRNTGNYPANTGVNNDEVCKINDMASNDIEWTTEYSTNQNSYFANPCVSRGGGSRDDYHTATRINDNATFSSKLLTFRPMLNL